MLEQGPLGSSSIYLDTKIEGFSNIGIAITIKGIGQGLKVAYVDTKGKATKFTNFIENLSLSYSFVKKFDRFKVNLYSFRENDKVSKTFIPQVEFNTISKDMFWKSLSDYDLIVFENVSTLSITEFKIINFIENKPKKCEVVFIMNDEKDFKKVKDNFNVAVEFTSKEKKNLVSNTNIINITGSGIGKSAYGFGHLIRSFIDKKDVKLIYFDKIQNMHGEMKFFESLKKWSKENNLYGKFDFVINQPKDTEKENIREAKDGLMLLKTALKKQTPVMADELNTVINKNFLSVKEVLDILNNAPNELIITGKNSPKEIIDKTHNLICVNNLKGK